jgi:hypothetical protein
MPAPVEVQVTSSGTTTIHTLPAVGQSTISTSLPVTVASDQPAILVSATALPLPTGAALEAGGNLATIAAAVIAQGSTTAGQKGSLDMGAVTTGAPAYTTGQTAPLSLDTSGNLRVNVVTGGGSGGTSSSFGATLPATGTAAGAEYLSAAPTLISGQMNPLLLDVNGNLKVNVAAGGASGGTSSTINATYPATATAVGAEYLSTAPNLTSGQMVALQTDVNGNLKVNNQNSGIGAANWNTSQVTVPATAGGIQLMAASSTRQSVVVVNLGTTPVWLGNSTSVTAGSSGNGTLLPGVVGATKVIPTQTAVWAITSSGTQQVSVEEFH